MIWDNAYNKTEFKNKCGKQEVNKIYSFIKAVKRSQKPESMSNDIFELIEQCWKQTPAERYNINKVINALEQVMY